MLVADNVRSITQKAVRLNVVRKQYFTKLLFSRIWVEYSFFNKNKKKEFCSKIDRYIIFDSDDIKCIDEGFESVKSLILKEIPRMVELEPPQHALAEDALIAAWYFCSAFEDVNIDRCIEILVRKYFAICDEYIQHFASIRSGGKFIDDNNTINSIIFYFELKQCCDYLGIADRLVAAEVISANLSGPPISIRWQG
jgi:hypothetical protein